MPRKKEFLEFYEARKCVHKLKLKSKSEWSEYTKKSDFPCNIPKNPPGCYKNSGWKSWGDWLGSQKIAPKDRTFLSFDEAKKVARGLNIKSWKDWQLYVKHADFPEDIPKDPSKTYKNKGWKSWGDWLGTKTIAPKDRQFLSFADAREVARGLNIKSWKDWQLFAKQANFPDNIPKDPSCTYRNSGWKSWVDWLNITPQKRKSKFIDYQKAKMKITGLGIKSQKEWFDYTKLNSLPQGVPKDPYYAYKNKGWISWGDWLSTGAIAPQNLQFLEFTEARDIVQRLKIKSSSEWKKLVSENKVPNNIPKNPAGFYKNSGWISWGDWLGTGYVANQERDYLTYIEAKNYVKNLRLSTQFEWREYAKSEGFPEFLPFNPDQIYKNKGWVSWGEWLGTNRIANQNKSFLTYDDANKLVLKMKLNSKEDWKHYANSEDFPEYLPVDPQQVYKNKGWKSWAEWLGYIGNGNHYWRNSSILTFLSSLKEELNNLSSVELITIINSNNLAKKLKDIGKLNDLVSSEPDSENRVNLINELIESTREKATSNEEIEKDELIDEAKSNIEEVFSGTLEQDDVIDDSSISDKAESHLLERDAEDFRSLHMYDSKMMTASLDDENLDFLMKNQLKQLWNDVLNGTKSISALKTEKGGKNFEVLKEWFFDEYHEIEKLKNPDGYDFIDDKGNILQPNLMQKLTAYRLVKEKAYGNWSGTGAGKTLSAIYSGRLAEAKNTVIICNNATVKGWVESIHKYFLNSHVYIKTFLGIDVPQSQYNVIDRYDIHLPNDQYNYLILNYETFQQKDAETIVALLIEKNQIDYVILDEVQNVKQRTEEKESNRRSVVNKLIIHARENNPDMLCMVMSATPVINNLYEPKALIELLTGYEHEDLKTTENIANGIEMYKSLTRHGLRYIPIYDMKLNQEIIPVDGSVLSSSLIDIKKGAVLDFELALLNTKLDAVKKYIKPGTLIYTHYVAEMADAIAKYVNGLGLSHGFYMGDDKSGLNDFKNKNVDVLIGSAPISTGVDGIQKVCNTLIPVCLPWTSAEYKQLLGRIYRQGSSFDRVNIYIPQVKIELDNGEWSWDRRRYNIIKYKATLADLVIDGRVPRSLLPSRSKMVQDAQKELSDWIERIKNNDVISFEREKLTVPLNPVQLEYQERKLGDFSEFNKSWSIKRSDTTHKELQKNPEDWFYYHTMYRERRKQWSEIPYVELAKRITRPDFVVADLGCGENLLKNEISNKVLSFDHIAIDDTVTACDISNLPLGNEEVDIAIFSLSLMGSNYQDYIAEAYRILKSMGFILIAEPKQKWEGKVQVLSELLETTGFTAPAVKETNQFIYWQSFKS